MTQPTDPTEPAVTLQQLTQASVGVADAAECAALVGHVAQLRGWIDAFESRLSTRMRHLHDTAGAAPVADQHTRCGGVSAAEGRRRDRRSKTLDDAPSFADALASGAVGAEHVDALANVAGKLDDGVKAELFAHQDDLLVDAGRMTPEQFGHSCRAMARRLERDHGIARNTRQRRETFLSRRLNSANGMIEGRYAFHPELASQVFGAVDHEVAAMIATGVQRGDPDFVDRSVDRNRLAAEALGTLVGGGHQQIRPTEADITIIVDGRSAATGELHDHSVCETAEGLDLPPASARRLACQARITPIVIDRDGNPFDMGRTVRNANRRQRRALRAIYRTCAFHGCDVSFDRCEIHHILPWELGGPTDLINLLPLCSRHHHVVHELGWVLELATDRTLTIRQPDGQVFAITRPDAPVDSGHHADMAEPHRQHRRRPAA